MRNPWDLKKTVFGKYTTPEQTMKEWYDGCLKLERLGKTLYHSKKDLLDWVIIYNRIAELEIKLNVFFKERLKTCPKKSKWVVLNKKYLKWRKKTDEIDNTNKQIIFNHEKKIKLLLNCKELKQYKRFFETHFFFDKRHQISRLSQIKRSAIQADDEVRSLFGALENDQGNYWCLDENNEPIYSNDWGEIMTNPSRHIRWHTWCNWYGQYRERANLYSRLFHLLHFRLGQDSTYSGYKTYIEKDLLHWYEISLKEYDKILSYCSIFKNLSIRFKDHLAGIISREHLIHNYEPWDYMLITKMIDKKYTDSRKEAERIVLESYKCLGKDFYNAAKWVFEHKLINWNKPRNSNVVGYTLTGQGALAAETISFTFDGTITDIATLSHEIGHNVAYYFSKKHQNTYKTHNVLTGEVCSTLCQYITMLWCIKNLPHRSERLCAMLEVLGSFQSQVCVYGANALFRLKYDQILMVEGVQPPDEVNKGHFLYRKWFEGLTKYEQHWYKKDDYDLIKYVFYESYYDGFVNNDGLAYYVGSIVGLAFADLIMGGSKPALRDFIKFLKAGGSKKPLQSLKIINTNLLNSSVYNYAKDVLKKVLVEFEKEPTLNKRGSLQYGKEKQEFNDKYERIK